MYRVAEVDSAVAVGIAGRKDQMVQVIEKTGMVEYYLPCLALKLLASACSPAPAGR